MGGDRDGELGGGIFDNLVHRWMGKRSVGYDFSFFSFSPLLPSAPLLSFSRTLEMATLKKRRFTSHHLNNGGTNTPNIRDRGSSF